MPTLYMFVPSGTSVLIPASWNVLNNKVEALGPGGNGTSGTGITNSISGGGGAYCFLNNVSSTFIQPGDTLSCFIAPANSLAQTTLNNRSSILLLAADFGVSGNLGGAGGQAANNTPANVGFSGGSGANAGDVLFQGCGGGGCAGPLGPGGNGTPSGATSLGGGAGASNGGSSGLGPSGGFGGNGGDNFFGTGHGVGGSSSVAATAGTLGGGGAGGGTGAFAAGSAGSIDNPWLNTLYGCGSGGGGAGATGSVAGNGGLYGGGGGSVNGGTFGLAGQGLLVFSWFVPSIVGFTGSGSSPTIRRSVRMVGA